MNDFLQRLRQRKLVQWALAYIAFAFALIQVLDVIAQRFGWPPRTEKLVILALALGFIVLLVLAWYHGEQGRQWVSGPELLLIALVLTVGGVVIWRFLGPGAPVATQSAIATVPASPGAPASAPAHAQQAAPASATTVAAKSIAVLPFENLSTEKANAYFADGMQDLILTKLTDIGDLKVISRTSTMQYGSHPRNLRQIARELGVAAVLEGSVQKAGNQVLINVQLIDAQTDHHLWADSYRRTLDDVFGVEGEVAGKVAGALNATLSPAEATGLATALSTSAAANDAFLRAEYFAGVGLGNYDTHRARQALPLYRKAIEIAPDFALARARLSRTESSLVWYGGSTDVRELSADARIQAEQAVKLAPNLPEAQLAMGYYYSGQGDYAAARKAFAAALKLRPNDAGALVVQSNIERRQGRFDAATTSLQRALTRDPRNAGLVIRLGQTHMMTGRWSDAEAVLHRALALDPPNVTARYQLSEAILFGRGDIAGALAAAAGDEPPLRLQRVDLLTYQRKFRDALTLLDAVPDSPDNFNFGSGGFKSGWQASLHERLGEMAPARALYAKALPQARALLRTAGGIANQEAFLWNSVARAELGLGHVGQALAALAKSEALVERTNDRVFGSVQMEGNAAVYARADRADLAVPLLARALATPGIGINYSPTMLWLDPTWDPIREDSRFQALLTQYARDKPAVIPAAPASAASPPTP